MDEFIKVATIEQIPDDEGLCLDVDGMPVAIFKVGNQFYAIEDVCPHQRSSFEGGGLEDNIVTCPLHGWKLDVVTGQSLEAPIKIETYEVKVVGSDIYIRF